MLCSYFHLLSQESDNPTMISGRSNPTYIRLVWGSYSSFLCPAVDDHEENVFCLIHIRSAESFHRTENLTSSKRTKCHRSSIIWQTSGRSFLSECLSLNVRLKNIILSFKKITKIASFNQQLGAWPCLPLTLSPTL
jgi:hypothetical protein